VRFRLAKADARRYVDLTCNVLRLRVVADLTELERPGLVVCQNLFNSNEAVVDFLGVISASLYDACQPIYSLRKQIWSSK